MVNSLNSNQMDSGKHFLLYFGDGEPPASRQISRQVPELQKRLKGKDYVCLPVSEIEESLEADMLEYMFPWDIPGPFGGGLEAALRDRYCIGERTGLLFIGEGGHTFYPISEEPVFSRADYAGGSMLDMRIEPAPKCVAEPEMSRKAARIPHGRKKAALLEDAADVSRQVAEDSLAPSVQAVVDAWERFSRQYGVSIDELARLLNEHVQFSRLVIKPYGAVFLADYGNREVKMDDLTKALYFFYLRHPEGVRQKELIDYRQEILDLYLRITRRGDLDEIRQSVDSLLFEENRINVSLSRIKKAFRDVVGDWVAKYYYVDGTAGNARSVKLDRDFVIWEH